VKTEPIIPNKVTVENQKTQDNFLALMLARKTLREFLGLITPDMLYTEEGRHLFEFLGANPDFDGKDGKKVKNLQDYVKIEALLYEELYQGLELNELHYEAARLQARLVEQFVKTQKTKLAEAMDSATPQEMRELLQQARQYDQLLNQVKGAVNG
jgi:hypothetical protein